MASSATSQIAVAPHATAAVRAGAMFGSGSPDADPVASNSETLEEGGGYHQRADPRTLQQQIRGWPTWDESCQPQQADDRSGHQQCGGGERACPALSTSVTASATTGAGPLSRTARAAACSLLIPRSR